MCGGVPQCVEACCNVWRRAAMCGLLEGHAAVSDGLHDVGQ